MGAVRAGSQKFGGRSRIAPAHFEGIRSGGDSRVGCRSTSCSDLCRGGGGTNGSGNGGGGWWKRAPPVCGKFLVGTISRGSCFFCSGGMGRVSGTSLRTVALRPGEVVESWDLGA